MYSIGRALRGSSAFVFNERHAHGRTSLSAAAQTNTQSSPVSIGPVTQITLPPNAYSTQPICHFVTPRCCKRRTGAHMRSRHQRTTESVRGNCTRSRYHDSRALATRAASSKASFLPACRRPRRRPEGGGRPEFSWALSVLHRSSTGARFGALAPDCIGGTPASGCSDRACLLRFGAARAPAWPDWRAGAGLRREPNRGALSEVERSNSRCSHPGRPQWPGGAWPDYREAGEQRES